MATSITAAARALKERQKNRNLPSVEVPQVDGDALARTLHGIQEHLRMYEGDSGAPKERFVTIAELENTGLIKSDVKGRFAYISQILEKDVAQMAGSTANPTQTDPVKTDTSRSSRTPDAGATGSGSTAPTLKLNDSQDVDVANPAKNEFLYYDGSKFTNFPLFKKDNTWFGQQRLEKPLVLREAATGPEVLEGLGYLWVKDGAPNTLWFTDDAGTEVQLGVTSAHAHVIADVMDFTDNSINWDTAYGWGDHASAGYSAAHSHPYAATVHTHLGTHVASNVLQDAAILMGVTANYEVTGDLAGNWGTLVSFKDAASRGFQISLGDTEENLSFRQQTADGTAWLSFRRIWTAADFADNSTNWNTAYGWGDHAGLYETADAAIVKSDETETISSIWDFTGIPTINSKGVAHHVSASYNSAKITVASSAPGSPAQGDIWFDTS